MNDRPTGSVWALTLLGRAEYPEQKHSSAKPLRRSRQGKKGVSRDHTIWSQHRPTQLLGPDHREGCIVGVCGGSNWWETGERGWLLLTLLVKPNAFTRWWTCPGVAFVCRRAPVSFIVGISPLIRGEYYNTNRIWSIGPITRPYSCKGKHVSVEHRIPQSYSGMIIPCTSTC